MILDFSAENASLRAALAQAQAALAAADGRIAVLEAALEPFAIVGKLIDRYLKSQPDGGPFKSGCAWEKDNIKRTLTWGDFRHARDVRARAAGERTDG